jgi:hypothetical protein
MFRYKLRTLLIVLALGPPVLAGAWFAPAYLTEDELRWGIAVIAHGVVAYVAYMTLAVWFSRRRASNM